MKPMMLAGLPGQDTLVMAVCITAGVIAVAFFVVVFTVDAREARRKSEARRSLRRMHKHSASGQHASDADDM